MLGLRNEQPIERVAMMARQVAHGCPVYGPDRQFAEPARPKRAD